MSEQTSLSSYTQATLPQDLNPNPNLASTESTVVDSDLSSSQTSIPQTFPNSKVPDTASLAYDRVNKTTGFIRKTEYNNGILDLTTSERMLKGIKVVEHSLDIEQAFKLGEMALDESNKIPKKVFPLVVHNFSLATGELVESELAQKLEQKRADNDKLAALSHIQQQEQISDQDLTQSQLFDQNLQAQEQQKIAQVQASSSHPNLNSVTDVTKVKFDDQAEQSFKDQVASSQTQANLEPTVVTDKTSSSINTDNSNDVINTTNASNLDNATSNPQVELTQAEQDALNEDISFNPDPVEEQQAIDQSAQVLASENNNLATSSTNTTNTTDTIHTTNTTESTANTIDESVATTNVSDNSEPTTNAPVPSNNDVTPEQSVSSNTVESEQATVVSESSVSTDSQEPTDDQPQVLDKKIHDNIESKAPVVVVDPDNPNLSHNEIVNLIDTARQFSPVEIEQKLRAQQQLASELEDTKHKALVPYALIVFGNNGMCLEQCLESVRSYCKRGVLIYNETTPGMQDDGSIDIAEEFVSQNPGFKIYRYPVPVIPANLTPVMDKLLNASIHRYWLLDCMYNYGLLHIHKLAQQNQEFNNALVFKVDPCVVYNTSALEYAHTILETHSNKIDYMMFDQVNVVGDYRQRKVNGLKKLLKVFVSSRRQNVTKAWFRKIDHLNSHFFCKLSKLTGFTTKFVIPTIGSHAEYDVTKPQVLAQFRYELETKFSPDIKGFSGINDDDVTTKVLVGYNFADDRSYMIDGTQVSYEQGQAYEGLPEEPSQIYKSIIDLDPEFWSKENLLELYSEFRLPSSLDPAYYLSDTKADLSLLFNNKLYTMDSYLVGFNMRLNALHDYDPDYDKFKSDEFVLSRLLNDMTMAVDITYKDCQDLV